MSYNSRHPPNSGRDSGYYPPARDFRTDGGGRRNRDRDHDRDRDHHRNNGYASSPSQQRHDSARDSFDSRDNYRPSNTSYSGRQDYSPRDSRSSYGNGRNPQPPPPSLPPPPPPPGPPPSDNYRVPQGDFSFRVARPAGIQEQQDSYRPKHHNQTKRHDAYRQRNGAYHNRFNRGGGRQPDRPFRQPWRPFVAAEREILHANHNTGSELAYYSTEGGVTYRNVDELSDSEEAEMDISGDEGDSPVEPSSKRARTSVNQSAADDSAPKWSNPDPYTALPPETANQKKKDVVQLIRKARVQAKETRSSLPSETADFIALDFDDSDQSNNSDDDIVIVSESKRTEEVTVSGSASSLPAVPVPTGPAREAKVPSLLPDFTSSALGSRKRTADDQIKLPHSKLKRPAKFPAGGQIVEEWRAVPHLTSTPWLRGDHSQSKDPLVWLHKEIVDFYDYIKPRHFEEAIREELVQEMKKVASMLGRDAVLHPFGSFPSGLYLPTGDMDLVVLSESFIRGGQAKYDKRNSLYKFRNVLHQTRVAWENDVELIAHAKVPLVKFVDKRTGLKVDISFENTTGLTAIRTFLAWKDQYPGMPALVTLIKHFLLMRGLNEPVNGGIGGFSVICLVVSMFQMMPEVQSGALDTQHHLGDLLLHFFDLYGNKFDLENVAIRLNPPGYIPKDRVHSLVYRNYNRLSIIDPNNPENDIAGGSSNAPKVFSLFSRTYQDLRLRMKSLAEDPQRSADSSILGTILGGNYTTFQEQRDYLEGLYFGHAPSSQEISSHQQAQHKGRRKGRK